MSINGKIAGQGIGRAIALRLANDGADIAIVDLNEEKTKAITEEVKAMYRRAMQGGGRNGAGLMAIGKSRARRYDQAQSKVTFDDVAGVHEAESELVEIVDFLKDPQKYSRLGGAAGKACC